MKGLQVIFTVILTAVVILILGLILINIESSGASSTSETIKSEGRRYTNCLGACKAAKACASYPCSGGPAVKRINLYYRYFICCMCADVPECKSLEDQCYVFDEDKVNLDEKIERILHVPGSEVDEEMDKLYCDRTIKRRLDCAEDAENMEIGVVCY